MGALDLGTWYHEAMAARYTAPGDHPAVSYHFERVATLAVTTARLNGISETQIEAAKELRMLGWQMAKAYDLHYGDDPDVTPIVAEIPLEFEITDDKGKVIALHKLKPDLVYADQRGDIWLMEHKTAKSIRLGHLPIDDQARPYVAMAELALRNAGVLGRSDKFRGVMYNFSRKAVPDDRPKDAQGRYLNKNGSVSKSQPPPYFIRHPVELSRASKLSALRRLQMEARVITDTTQLIRADPSQHVHLLKTPHSSCTRFCDFFTMCVLEEQGGDVKEMERSMYFRENPYTYLEDTTDESKSFEFG
jgi:hypothetical protein